MVSFTCSLAHLKHPSPTGTPRLRSTLLPAIFSGRFEPLYLACNAWFTPLLQSALLEHLGLDVSLSIRSGEGVPGLLELSSWVNAHGNSEQFQEGDAQASPSALVFVYVCVEVKAPQMVLLETKYLTGLRVTD